MRLESKWTLVLQYVCIRCFEEDYTVKLTSIIVITSVWNRLNQHCQPTVAVNL